MTTVVVVAGGLAPPPDLAARLPAVDVVIAADSGLDHALALGLVPSILVGDLDSVSAAGLDWAAANDVAVQRHDVDKDQTDLELALDVAVGAGDRIVVVDGGNGRLDHAFGNLALLAMTRYASHEITAMVGAALVTVVHDERRLLGQVDELVSLFAIGGTAEGVRTVGLRWPLVDATLEPGTTWGVSNRFVAGAASVSIRSGVLLAIQPGQA